LYYFYTPEVFISDFFCVYDDDGVYEFFLFLIIKHHFELIKSYIISINFDMLEMGLAYKVLEINLFQLINSSPHLINIY